MTERPRGPLEKTLAVLYLLAALVALGMALAPRIGFRCDACSGGLASLSLPWIGAVFYGALAAVAVRSPERSVLALALGFYVFVHADLVAEMLLDRRWCWGCFAVATLALAAAGCQVARMRREGLTLAVAA